MPKFLLVAVMLFATLASGTAKKEIQKSQIEFGGHKRTYYSYVPSSLKPDEPAPLLLLLHGSGRDGQELVKPWKDLAEREGIILVGPDAFNSKNWDSSADADSPDFMLAVITDIMSKTLVDPERLYVFGHSAGAKYGLMLGLFESKYFAAVAVHAGSLQPSEFQLAKLAERKIPLAIWAGQWDEIVPLNEVVATVDALKSAGFDVRLVQMSRHTHDYAAKADEVNIAAWNFLKDKMNPDTQFTKYDWAHPRALR
jgi:poly(3-hydroxybutyrate) depolymerase